MRMTSPFILIVLICASCASEVYRNQSANISAVPQFEATQYLGKWYEIARLPNRFEKNCVGVTAEYTQKPDGEIEVRNTCRKKTLEGVSDVAIGSARIEDVGKLTVTFTPYLPFIRGDYWVLGLKNYDIAVVGNPKGKTAWILARNPQISESDRDWANRVLQDAGYDFTKLYDVPQ